MTLRVCDGELHIDPTAWIELVGTEPSPEALDVARQVPGGEQALAAGSRPLAVVQLETATPTGVWNHEVWLGADAAALLVHTAEGQDRHLIPLRHDQVAAALARLAGVGPRDPMPDDMDRRTREVGMEEIEAWFVADRDVRRGRLAPFGADRAWRLVAHAVGSLHEPIVLGIADGANGGPWRLESGGDGFVAVPVTPTAVFRELASVVPLLGQDITPSR
ncbi:MAG: hypothetical protein QM638_10545 [Nocardioides sp.]|uniref:hypothetical protein n=1 Tax=Nocardioides sp. TaxID=35761 RepID=UPI0039E2AC28